MSSQKFRSELKKASNTQALRCKPPQNAHPPPIFGGLRFFACPAIAFKATVDRQMLAEHRCFVKQMRSPAKDGAIETDPYFLDKF